MNRSFRVDQKQDIENLFVAWGKQIAFSCSCWLRSWDCSVRQFNKRKAYRFICFMWLGSCEEHSLDMSGFCSSVDGEWTVMEKYGWAEGPEVNGMSTALCWCPLCLVPLEKRMLFLLVGRAHLTWRSFDLLQGKAVKSLLWFMTCLGRRVWWGNQSHLPASTDFLKSLHLKIAICWSSVSQPLLVAVPGLAGCDWSLSDDE